MCCSNVWKCAVSKVFVQFCEAVDWMTWWWLACNNCSTNPNRLLLGADQIASLQLSEMHIHETHNLCIYKLYLLTEFSDGFPYEAISRKNVAIYCLTGRQLVLHKACCSSPERLVWCPLFTWTFVQGHRSLWDRGDMSHPIFMKGDILGNVPLNILNVMSFRMSTQVTATVVCFILT